MYHSHKLKSVRFQLKVSQLHKSCHLHIFWGVQPKARTIFQESLEPVRRHETFALRMKKEYCNIQLLYQLVFHRLVSCTSFTRHRLAQRELGLSEIYRSHAWCCPFPIMKLIGRRSSYIVLAIVYEWQTKDKKPQRSNVNTKKRLSFARARWQMNTTLNQNRPEDT